MVSPALRTVVIVGTGMMGTSVALALRRHGVRTYLLDRDPAALSDAVSLGAGIAGDPPDTADLAVVAVPPGCIGEVLAEHQRYDLAHAYTDVGSVKTLPFNRARALDSDLTRYVGGHPLAGRERSGPSAAAADLFDGRVWVLTPHPTCHPDTVWAAEQLVALCGARPVSMPHEEHDRILARTSHVPHLVAAAVAAALDGADHTARRLCGPGVKDTTRIAAGDAELWTDILRANATEIEKVLREISADLTAAAGSLITGSDDLTTLLRRGNAGQALIADNEPGNR